MSAPQPAEAGDVHTDQERAAIVVGYLRELTDTAMEHARTAAKLAKEQLENPPEPPARGTPKPPDYNALFIRYANLVRSLVAAELRLAARPAAAPAPRAAALVSRPPDHRRDRIMLWIDKLLKGNPDRTALRRSIAETLEELLLDAGLKTQPFGEVLFRLCRRYGLPWDVKKLPDEFLIPPASEATVVAKPVG